MRSNLCVCLFLSLLALPAVPLHAANETPAGGETPAPQPAVQPVPTVPTAQAEQPAAPEPGKGTPTGTATPIDAALAEAIESIIDEDEATRTKAFTRLNAATSADLPTLEKYESSTDPEIRKQVGLILQRLRRGEAAFTLQFADGKPAAGQKVTVRLIELVPLEKTDDSQKQANGGAVAAGGGGQVQVVINGNVGVGQMVVVGNGVRIVGGNGQGGATQKEVFVGELTADADGKVVVGRYNDGKYQYLITTSDPLPVMNLNGTFDLTQNAKPQTLEVHHGVSATVTATDEDGKPLAGVVVMNFDPRQLRMQSTMPPMQLLNWRRTCASAETDDKGLATLEKINATELTLIGILRGYELAGGETKSVKDGEAVSVTFKMIKCKPVACTLTLKTKDNKPLINARVVVVTSDQAINVFGGAWSVTGNAKDIPTYLEKGAIDLGTTDDKGVLECKLVQDQYAIVAFPKDDSKGWYGQIFGKNPIHEKLTLTFNPITPMPTQPGQ